MATNRENLFTVRSGNNTQSLADNVKSFGELNPNSVDTDDEEFSALNTTSKQKTNDFTNVTSTLVDSSKKVLFFQFFFSK